MRTLELKVFGLERQEAWSRAPVRLLPVFPELSRNEMSNLDDQEDCVLQLFAGPPHVITTTNATAFSMSAMVELIAGARLFDSFRESEVSLDSLNLTVHLEPWQSVAFELRLGGHLNARPVRIAQVLQTKGSEQL